MEKAKLAKITERWEEAQTCLARVEVIISDTTTIRTIALFVKYVSKTGKISFILSPTGSIEDVELFIFNSEDIITLEYITPAEMLDFLLQTKSFLS